MLGLRVREIHILVLLKELCDHEQSSNSGSIVISDLKRESQLFVKRDINVYMIDL